MFDKGNNTLLTLNNKYAHHGHMNDLIIMEWLSNLSHNIFFHQDSRLKYSNLIVSSVLKSRVSSNGNVNR